MNHTFRFFTFTSSFFALVFFIVNVPLAHAAANNVQYSTILDYSPTDILLEQQSFGASSTYDCNILSQACSSVPSSQTALIPSVLSNQSAYFLSQDNSEVLIPTYAAGSAPVVKLYAIQNNTLVPQATLPSFTGVITRVLFASNDTTFILVLSDGSMQKYDLTTNQLTPVGVAYPSGASWINVSPNGDYIAYFMPATPSTNQRTYGVIDTDTGIGYTMLETVNYWDLISEGVRVFAFSPDSTKLLYLDDRNNYQTLYEVNLADLATDGLAGTQITTKPYSIEDMVWENNSTILMSANRDNPLQWSLYELNLDTYAINKVTDWMSYDAPMEKIGNFVLFQTADANGRLTKLYNLSTKAISTLNIPGVTDTKVGTNNTTITIDTLHGVYMKPATPSNTLLVWLHGGPDRQDSIEYNSYMSYGGYDWVLNQLETLGVPILKLDYPGSLGYGRPYAESIVGGVGTVDAKTTMYAIEDFAQAHGYTNIYLMGNSYGGYLALKMLVSYPDQVKGVLALSAVTDWYSLLSDVPSSIFAVDFNGPPSTTNQNLYDAASIINNVKNIGNQKVIIVQGNADTEVPYSQSVLLNDTLAAAHKNVEYDTLDGEDHIYEQPSSYTLVCNKALELLGLPSSPLCTMSN